MKRLFRLIFALPMFLLRLVWSFVWGLVKTAIILGLIIWGLLYYANNSSSAFAQNLSQTFTNLTSLLATSSPTDVTDSLANLSTDSFKSYDGARWATNSATVYIETTDPTFVAAYQEAIANWNATGAFTFSLVDSQSQADIVATDYSDANSQAAGLAESQVNLLTNQLTHVDVKLNSYFLLNSTYGYTYARIVNTAEHELGHAIGLDHDDSQTSVMQSAGSNYGIQATDIATLQALYAT